AGSGTARSRQDWRPDATRARLPSPVVRWHAPARHDCDRPGVPAAARHRRRADDGTIQAQVLELLRELKARYNLALLLITHDFGVIAEMADRVAVMYQGRLVEHGSVREVLRRPSHNYTRNLLAAVPGAW